MIRISLKLFVRMGNRRVKNPPPLTRKLKHKWKLKRTLRLLRKALLLVLAKVSIR
jgi:hypothetical protein